MVGRIESLKDEDEGIARSEAEFRKFRFTRLLCIEKQKEKQNGFCFWQL